MTKLTQEELDQGKKVLGGIITLLWVVAILTGIGYLSREWGLWFMPNINIGPASVTLPSSNGTFIFLALYVAELVGIHMRKPWAVPLGRAALVVTMVIFFPVGTIFGAILWKRINGPVAKKYLNYSVDSDSQGKSPESTK
jgi:hypothetical protein